MHVMYIEIRVSYSPHTNALCLLIIKIINNIINIVNIYWDQQLNGIN